MTRSRDPGCIVRKPLDDGSIDRQRQQTVAVQQPDQAHAGEGPLGVAAVQVGISPVERLTLCAPTVRLTSPTPPK
jgi:hypothetical protein